MQFGCRIYVSSVDPSSPAGQDGRLRPGDTVLQLGGAGLEGLGLAGVHRILRRSRHQLGLLVERGGDRGEAEGLLAKVANEEHKPSNLSEPEVGGAEPGRARIAFHRNVFPAGGVKL